MNYQEQLSSDNWQAKRVAILKRDNKRCLLCRNGNLFSYGEIAYINGFMPSKTGTAVDLKLSDSREIYAFIPRGVMPKVDNGLLVVISRQSKRELENIEKEAVVFLAVENHTEGLYDRQDKFEANIDELKSFDLETVKWGYIGGLHIHHTYYQHGLLAWEYPDEALQTLCYICHEQTHKAGKTPVRGADGRVIGEYHNCDRCNGAGYFPRYRHVNGGVCFRCKGARYEELRAESNAE
ncbi:hypothetical protein [Rufibacter roseus]|uniref:Uncharacterized protein n=1 Tax=Rufibacter roseus TaxID=1567108 RepID=A0ABW2DI63_9BACT|nr:hypothetical protein [Rufibacter roseus]